MNEMSWACKIWNNSSWAQDEEFHFCCRTSCPELRARNWSSSFLSRNGMSWAFQNVEKIRLLLWNDRLELKTINQHSAAESTILRARRRIYLLLHDQLLWQLNTEDSIFCCRINCPGIYLLLHNQPPCAQHSGLYLLMQNKLSRNLPSAA